MQFLLAAKNTVKAHLFDGHPSSGQICVELYADGNIIRDNIFTEENLSFISLDSRTKDCLVFNNYFVVGRIGVPVATENAAETNGTLLKPLARIS